MAGVTPVGASAHFDVPLSNLAVSAFNDTVADFIADQIFPMVGVGKQSDKYYIIDKDQFLSTPTQDGLRAPKTQARRVEFQISSDSYFAHNYALANENSLEDLANADNAIRLRENSVRLVTGQLRRSQEVRIANILTSATNLGSGAALTGANKWSDYVNSDPLGDVTTAHAFIRAQTGLVANTAILDWDTFQVLQRHPDILELFKYTNGGMATMDQLRSVFKVDRILVGKGIKNNALEGATASITNIWGNNFVLAHVGMATGLQTQTLGLRFEWQPAGFPAAFAVERRVESGAGTRKVEIIEAGHFQDAKIVAADLGYAITGTL